MRHTTRLTALVAALALAVAGITAGSASAASISSQIRRAQRTANKALKTARTDSRNLNQLKGVTNAAITQVTTSVQALTAAVAGLAAKVGPVVAPTGLIKLGTGNTNVTLLSSSPYRIAANCTSSGGTTTAQLFLTSSESGVMDGWNGTTFGGGSPDNFASASGTSAATSANKFTALAPSGAYIDGTGLAGVNIAGAPCTFDVSNISR